MVTFDTTYDLFQDKKKSLSKGSFVYFKTQNQLAGKTAHNPRKAFSKIVLYIIFHFQKCLTSRTFLNSVKFPYAFCGSSFSLGWGGSVTNTELPAVCWLYESAAYSILKVNN
jgi:hypothetical protein